MEVEEAYGDLHRCTRVGLLLVGKGEIEGAELYHTLPERRCVILWKPTGLVLTGILTLMVFLLW
mgnify:CR=1 FL=1